MSAQNPFLTTFEAAKICHASPGSVVRWIREGKLPSSVTAGGHHRIRRFDLIQFLKKLRMPIPAELEEKNAALHYLVISAQPKNLQKIQKMLKQQFPQARCQELQ